MKVIQLKYMLNHSRLKANPNTITARLCQSSQNGGIPPKNDRLTERGNSVVFKALQHYTVTATVRQAVFFYLKFLSNNGTGLLGLFHSSEFAVRATPRNKAFLRTNNRGWCNAVVEPLSHLYQAVRFYQNFTKTLQAMIFKFLLLGKKRLNISIRANSEAEARQRLQFTSPAILVARMATNGGQA